MIIRKVKKEDLKRLDEIYVEGSIDEGKLQFPNVSNKEMLKQLKKFKEKRINGWKRELKSDKNYWIVVEEDNRIIGFGNAEIKKKFEYKEGKIRLIYVDKRFRKKGIGIKIGKELIKWLKNKKVKYIESGIYWNNKPSIKLHEKLRFKPLSLKMRLK